MDVLPTFILKPLAFLFVLTVVIFVHELGHFLVARWCGVRVKTFSIGFGKEIFGFNDRYNTRWRLAWIPLGGYVKFLDDENSASVPSRDALQRCRLPNAKVRSKPSRWRPVQPSWPRVRSRIFCWPSWSSR